MTREDYRSLPESRPRYQLVEGQLYVAPTPNRYRQVISRNIGFMLLRYLEQHPIGELYHAPFDVYLTEHNVFQPDIVFIAKNNYNVLNTPAKAFRISWSRFFRRATLTWTRRRSFGFMRAKV